jgi:hypothetical protein
MKQWLMYLMCVGPPSSSEHVDQVNELRNDEGEAYEGLIYGECWSSSLGPLSAMWIMKNDLL